jgi:hypothetical protein
VYTSEEDSTDSSMNSSWRKQGRSYGRKKDPELLKVHEDELIFPIGIQKIALDDR